MNTKVCFQCPDRKVGCHGKCEKYKELKAYYEWIRKQKGYENEFHDYAVKTAMRNSFNGERLF